MEQDPRNFEVRLNRLATWNRVLSIVIVAGLFAFILNQTSESETLRAASFQLVDDAGVLLAEFAVRDGNPGLYLVDADGNTRAAMFHAPDGTGLYIMDSDGVTRIGIAQFAHGGGGIALHGEQSRGAAVLYLKEKGSLRFFNADGNVTNEFGSDQPSPSN